MTAISDLRLPRGFEDGVESLDGAPGTQPLCQLVSDVPDLKRAHSLLLVTTSSTYKVNFAIV
jgi:hypothetical protein